MNTFEENTMNDDFSSKHRIDETATMATVGYFTTFNKNGKQESQKFKVFVCGDEGEIPHMHIWDDETNGKNIHTCVCLDKIEYFHHTGKEDILTPNQKRYLVDFLKEECKKNKRYKTNWEYALSMWNDNNTDKTQVDENSEVLDYTKLEGQNYETMDELDIFDFNNIPMSELDKAYIDYEPLYDTVDWFSVDED